MLKVLFLSLEDSHNKIFSLIEAELTKKTKRVICNTVDVGELDIKIPYFKRMFDRERVQYATEMIKKFQPSIIVVANDQGLNATFIKICNLMRIPTLAVQDGILAEKKVRNAVDILRWKNYFFWRVISSVTSITPIARIMLFLGWRTRVLDWGLGGASKIAVMGDYYARLLKLRGVPWHRITITGYPLLDNVVQHISGFDRTTVIQKLKLKESNPLALLITQPFVEDRIWSPTLRRKLVESVIRSVNQVNGLQLVIKIHPRESLNAYEKIIRELNEEIVLVRDFDLHELLMASDFVLTVSSTVGIWAMVYKKPLIVIKCFPLAYRNIYEEGVSVVSDLKDLFTAIRNAMLDPDKKTDWLREELFLRDHVYKLDGKASSRIAELITRMAKQDDRIH